jgi:hypothetical protein
MFAGGTESYGKRITPLLSTRLELSRTNVSDEKYTLVVDIVANLATPPASVLELPVTKGKGVDRWVDIVRVATGVGILTKRGPWYFWGRDAIGQGEKAVAKYLRLNPTDFTMILSLALQKLSQS